MGLRELFVALVALLCLGLGLLLLEQPRTGLTITPVDIGGIPATLAQVDGVDAPLVVIAHGFAGSRQRMHPVQWTLARAGYVTLSFDIAGHGRNPGPMRPGPNPDDGSQTAFRSVIDAGLRLPGVDGRVALVGQSVAADAMVTQAVEDARIGPVVALSLTPDPVTQTAPANLLIVNGALEWRLRAAARQVMGSHSATEGETIGAPQGSFARRAIAAPWVEGFGLPYSATTLREGLDWLNASFGRNQANGLALIGGPILLTLLGLVLLAQPMAQALPPGRRVSEVPPGAFWTLALVPAILTPLVLRLVGTDFLPMLAADYLAVHLAVFGVLVLAGLAVEGDLPRLKGWPASLAIAGYGILVVGGILDRYVLSFAMIDARWTIFALLLPGAVLAMVADATLIQAGQAAFWRRLVARGAMLGSLLVAVILNRGQMFPVMSLIPVLLFFFLTYGVIGGWVGRRTGSSAAMGLGLGVVLAWALAATLPIVEDSL